MVLDPEIRRRLNDHRRRLFEDTAGEIAFLCECADPTCTRAVVLSPAAFDDLRESGQVLLQVGHQALAVGPLPAEDAAEDLLPVDPIELDPVQLDLPEIDPAGPEPLQ